MASPFTCCVDFPLLVQETGFVLFVYHNVSVYKHLSNLLLNFPM